MAFDFINTTLTGATLSGSIATIGTPFLQPGAASGALNTYTGLTCAVTSVAAGVQSLLVSGSGLTGNTKLFFLNGLLISASVL